jgi:integrase
MSPWNVPQCLRKNKFKLDNWPALGLAEARDLCRVKKEVVVAPGTLQNLMDCLFEGKTEGKSLHANSLSRAVTKLYGRHADKFEGPFTLSDIRRTCKTLMGAVGIEKELKDRIQGHAFSDVSSKHYDRYDNFKEKQTSLEIWGNWLWDNVVTAELHS